MRKILLIIILFIPSIALTQIKFLNYEFDLNNRNLWLDKAAPDSLFFYTDSDADFDLISQHGNAIVFDSDIPTEALFAKTYVELLNLFGPEDENRDIIPENYKNGLTTDLLIELIMTREAAVGRVWKSHPDFDVTFVVTSKLLQVIFAGK